MRYRHRDIIRTFTRVPIPGCHPFVREQLEYVRSLVTWSRPTLAPDTDHDTLLDIVDECDAIIANLRAHSRHPLVLAYLDRLTPDLDFLRDMSTDEQAALWAAARSRGEI